MTKPRKIVMAKDRGRVGCRLIRGIFLVLFLPLVPILWFARFIDDYGSDFIYWIDDLVESICWYYVKWRKNNEDTEI